MVAEQAERHGQDSAEVAHASSAAVRLCNELALSAMQHGSPGFSFEHAHTYLQRALHMPSASPSLIPVTLNNLSIFYTRTGQPQKALRCLLRVVKQAKVPSSSQDSVAVHAALNLTTVLADMGRHREALQMAQQAVRTLPRSANGRSADPSLLCAAYHNLAVQQERLGSTAGHMQSYRAALAQVRRTADAKDAQMVSFIEQAYVEAQARQASHRPQREGTPGSAASLSPSKRRAASAASPKGQSAYAAKPAPRSYTVGQLYKGAASPSKGARPPSRPPRRPATGSPAAAEAAAQRARQSDSRRRSNFRAGDRHRTVDSRAFRQAKLAQLEESKMAQASVLIQARYRGHRRRSMFRDEEASGRVDVNAVRTVKEAEAAASTAAAASLRLSAGDDDE